MRNWIFLICLSVILSNCSTDSTSLENNKLRGHDPWVFRSVLDQMPRMITMALDSNVWIAYHTDKGSMYKVWEGGVSFEGAVYDYAHGPQPSSYGYAYTINAFENPWKLSSAGQDISFTYNYRGHKLSDDRVALMYELVHDNGTVKIEESPELIINEKGDKILNQTFNVSGLSANEKLALQKNVSSLVFDTDVNAEKGWNVDDQKEVKFEENSYVDLNGTLQLKNGTTTLNTILRKATLADPNAVEAALVEASDAPYGLQLISKNDCKTCHNKKVKTIGPAYVSIAQKYADTDENINLLTSKVKAGGTGVWGQQVMNAHPEVAESDIRQMVKYILDLDDPKDDSGAKMNSEVKTYEPAAVKDDETIPGSIVRIWKLNSLNERMPKNLDSKPVLYAGILSNFDNIYGYKFTELEDDFALTGEGYFYAEEDNEYSFRVWSDDGSLLYLHGEKIIDNDGLHGTEYREAKVNLKKGYHPFKLDYFQGSGGKFLSLNYKPKGAEKWAVIPRANIFHTAEMQSAIRGKKLPMSVVTQIPGDKASLTSMHPSFDLHQAKPEGFEPKVGGLDFMSNGDVVISTWDPSGSVYLLKNTTGNQADITVKKIASGFAEPLGLKVVDDIIYIMQKQELTKLIDNDGDEIIDEYITLCDDWGVTANFHEFGFGLEYKDGHFYAALATGILPGGASMPNQHKNRGSLVQISKDGSEVEFIANGLRTPNGVGIGYNDEIFVADNQGDWLPSCKIMHVTKGAWFGSRSVDFEGTADKTEKLPVVWLPQDEIGNSPSTPLYINIGPYKNQMIHGEVTHGGIKRVFVEEVNGQLQGAVFRFMQGFDAGINRIRWAPDGSLYAGGIGNPGNWGQTGKKWFGLQRVVYNENPTFEMLAIRAKSNGIEIEFTEPLQDGDGWLKDDYRVRQWYYKPTIDYGGPKLDEKDLAIKSVNVGKDRKKVFLELEGMKENHVIYVRLQNKFISDNQNPLWTTEGWYTLNHIPQNDSGFKTVAPTDIGLVNALSQREKDAGWKLLFDGKNMDQFKGYKKDKIGSSWKIDGDAIMLNAIRKDGKSVVEDGGDLITKEEYENFEFRLEWKISNCGNSGIMYNVKEAEEYWAPYSTGPEMQILDNVCHPDTRYDTHRAGDLYDMIECSYVAVNPAGEWNKVRIISNEGQVVFWLNGAKVVEFTMFGEEWKNMIANSKFADWDGFGKYKSGHIALQDHSDKVWFRNIKIKRL